MYKQILPCSTIRNVSRRKRGICMLKMLKYDASLVLIHVSQYMNSLIHSTFSFADLSEIDVNTFLGPFLDVIRSEDTTGPITGVALSSVNKFLSYSLIGKDIDLKFIVSRDPLYLSVHPESVRLTLIGGGAIADYGTVVKQVCFFVA